MTVLSVRQPRQPQPAGLRPTPRVNLARSDRIFIHHQPSVVRGAPRGNSRGIRGGVGRVRVDELVVDRGAGAGAGDCGRDSLDAATDLFDFPAARRLRSMLIAMMPAGAGGGSRGAFAGVGRKLGGGAPNTMDSNVATKS